MSEEWLRKPNTEPLQGYRLIEPLGRGGFGEVWKCEVPGGIFKAIKFVYGNLNVADSDSAKAEQEFKALEKVKSVRHPFVLSMDMIKILQGELVIVMELADKSLHDVLLEYQKEGRPGIPRDMLLGFMSDAAEGLDHMIEKHNLQHLDVKPKNLFLIADRVKVADFGLVSAVERTGSSNAMAGITPVYTSPETFQNKISKQSDQYSLAIVYHELLTGKWVFHGKNVRQLAMQHMTQPPDLAALPESDRPIIARALSKNPDDRFPNCIAFVRSLFANSMVDPSISNSLYNTSAGLRHAVASASDTGQFDPGRMNTPAPIATPGPVYTTPSPLNPPKTNPPPTFAATPAPNGKPNLVTPRTSGNSHKPSGTPFQSPDPFSMPTPGRPAQKTGGSAGLSSSPSSTSTNSRSTSGVLRPTLILGIGSFGVKAIEQIRARLLDRIGHLENIPCVRFLCLDSIPDSFLSKSLPTSEIALDPEQILNLPLQSPNNYRRRQMDQLLEWLPKEKLNAISRDLTVGGNRALGRLAFCDNSMKVYTRIRNEIHAACQPDALATSSDKTGLAILTRTPAIHVFASASGGTGGMLVDAGYCIRRAMEKSDIQRGPVTAFVFAGATQDPSTPAAEQSNVIATMVELNHFADSDVAFTAQYGGPDGLKIEETGPPFTANYLLNMQERTKSGFDDCLANLAGYIVHDMTTPLGATLDKFRRTPPGQFRTPFRQFGTFGLWYPRGLVIREAARQLCAETVMNWTSNTTNQFPVDVDRSIQKILSDQRLVPDSVAKAIDRESVRKKMESQTPVQIVNGWIGEVLAEAENEAKATVGWGKAVMGQTNEYIGMQPSDENDSKFTRGKLSQTLDRGVLKYVEIIGNELVDAVRPLSELPGVGLSACDFAIQQLKTACQSTINSLTQKLQDLSARRQTLHVAVNAAATGCDSPTSSLSLFGGRSTQKNKKAFAERFKQFADIRVEEDLISATVRFYQKLSDRLNNLTQDLSSCRQQLSDLYRELAAPFTSSESSNASGIEDQSGIATTLKMTNTIRIVLPNGEDRLDRAATELIVAMSKEDKYQLQQYLQRQVLEPRGGLIAVTKNMSNLAKQLAPLLTMHAGTFLMERVPAEDVTAIEASLSRGRPDGYSRRVDGYLRAAGTHVIGPAAEAKLFVTLPDTQSGKNFGDEVLKVHPNAQAVVVHNHYSDLLFCREQDWMRQSDLRDMVSICWDAYAESCESIETSPHTRFDVQQWMPLISEPANRY